MISPEHKALLEIATEVRRELAGVVIPAPSSLYTAYSRLCVALGDQAQLLKEDSQDERSKGVWTDKIGLKWELTDRYYYDRSGYVWHWSGGYQAVDSGNLEPLMSRNDWAKTDVVISEVVNNFGYLRAIVTENGRGCASFKWIGQSWLRCEECDLPTWQHEGVSVSEPNSGPFDDLCITQPWKEGEWVDQIRKGRGKDLIRVKPFGVTFKGGSAS